MATYLVEQPDERGPQRRMSDWSAEVELLSSIVDRLGEVVQAVAALGGAKVKRIRPAPRPVVAAERVRKRMREQRHRAVVARMLPHSQST